MHPKIIYGTAWKEDQTKSLVGQALDLGYRAIDTANQRRHYNEAQSGEAIKAWIQKGHKRSDLFLQSKFTYINGQDHRLPYDPNATTSEQVIQSFESTLKHFDTDYLDAYLLHGPSSQYDFTSRDWEVWETMEDLYARDKVKSIGLSNVGLSHIETLYETAKVKPGWVQIRCYANSGWDQPLRSFCLKNSIHYQGFSLLTANPYMLQHPIIQEIASRSGKTLAQTLFKFTTQIGIIPLTGTTDETHMIEDLDIWDIEISKSEVESLENAAYT